MIGQVVAARCRMTYEGGRMKVKTWGIASIAGAMVIVGTVLAAQSGAAPNPPGTTTTLHVQELSKRSTYVPIGSLVGASGQSAHQGDYIAVHDPLVKPGTKTTVGSISVSCVLTQKRAQIFYCSADYFIAGKGHVMVDALYNAKGKTTHGAIVGGTGAYEHASGTVQVKVLNQNRNDFVLTFTT
jgi:hypothetical protein